MKRLGLWCFLFTQVGTVPASADWRWPEPVLPKQKITYSCASLDCIKQTYLKERRRFKHRIASYNKARLREWMHWTGLYIPTCTWYGESGTGPEFASYRYTMPNSTGSGAYGKYQFMPSTYFTYGKYDDWSPLDQEIAGHRLYWSQGTAPWTNC
jgi:hypothetical protein